MNTHSRLTKTRAAKALLLVGAATALQGCVAAVVPIAASGLLAGRGAISGDDTTAAPVQPAPAPAPAPPPAVAAVPQNPTGTVTVGSRDPEMVAVIDPATEPAEMAANVSDAIETVDPGLAMENSERLASTPEVAPEASAVAVGPAPQTPPVSPVSVVGDAGFAEAYRPPNSASNPASSSAEAAAALAARSGNAATSVAVAPVTTPERPISRTTRTVVPQATGPALNSITQMLSYANQRQFISGQNRTSAMLADRVSLEPKRAQCGGVKPAVLIDLDPEGGMFAPATASNPPAGLGAGLAQLRAQGMQVAWISKNPDENSNLIRRALTRSGLDIYGRDTVLLIQKDDDRKQTLREEFAKTHCVVAIAGDARSDFDELYDYLLDPSEADSLAPLFGEGWFLIPQPLVSEGS